MKLFYFIVGCRPEGRLTEQHDVFFCIAEQLSDCVPLLQDFWPNTRLHIDSYMIINSIQGHDISIASKKEKAGNDARIFFVNLGPYIRGQMEEFHHKALCVANSRKEAIAFIKKNADFSHLSSKVFQLHTDDSFGFDVDEIFEVEEALPLEQREKFSIELSPTASEFKNELHIGYLPLTDIK